MATEKFNTILGPTWFKGRLLAKESHPGEIGQWQKGVFEVVGRWGKGLPQRPLYTQAERGQSHSQQKSKDRDQ